MNSTKVHSFNVSVSFLYYHYNMIQLSTIARLQGSGSGGIRRKTEVSVDITQSIRMDRIQSDHGLDRRSYDEQKLATVA